MTPFAEDYFKNLQSQFDEIQKTAIDSIEAINKNIEILESKIEELHSWLMHYHFKTQEEEIDFFKEQKPRLISLLIFYKKILEIKSVCPGSKKIKSKYFENELEEIAKYIGRNKTFYHYYRSKSDYNDSEYFTRNRDRKLSYYQCHIINYDIRVSTSHDYDVAMIKANELLVTYLEDKIAILENKTEHYFPKGITPIQWTGNKIDLVEVIYALHTQKVLNNRATDIKVLAKFFSQSFNVDLEDNIYRWYLDIKNRKTTQTKFLNTLSENLTNKITEEEF